MIPLVFNGNNVFLLDDWPEWGRGNVAVDATIPVAYERGLTGKETRRNTGDTLRLALSWTSLLKTPVQITSLRNSLQAIAQQPVLCPFWPARFAPGQTPPATTAYYVLFNADYTFNSIVAAAAIAAQSAALIAFPVLVGILTTLPDPSLLTSTITPVDFLFAENDSSYLTPPAFVPPAGIAAAAGVRPLFPFVANWVTSPKSGMAEFDIDRVQIGSGRGLSQVYYNQRNRRRVQQDLLLRNGDALNLLSFFTQMGGEAQGFWLPANLKESWLTAAVLATDTALHVDNGAALGTNSFVCLNDGHNRVPLVVSSVVGNQWNLSGAVGTAFASANTNVESLMLARFDEIKLTLNFLTATVVKASLHFKELPWETAAVAGETIGTTMGTLPSTAQLYVLTLTTPGAATVWRFTNFERNLTNGGNTYTSAPIEHNDITSEPNLKRQNTELKMRNFPGNPLALFFPFQLEFPMTLDIYEADVAGNAASNLRCYFSGEVGDVDLDGPIMRASCSTLSWIFERATARRIYQPDDNWNLFEPSNGLTASDWQWNALVVSYNAASATLVIGTIAANNVGMNGAAVLVANYFAAGYVSVVSAGGTQYRMVAASTALAGGQIMVHLSTPLVNAPAVGDVVAIFAGYDGQYETFITKFAAGNGKFGGFPFMPIGNPFVMKITQNPNGAGKK